MPGAESSDLGTQVLLGVEPGPGHSGLAADAIETDPLAGGVHAPQRGDGTLAGLLGPALGSPGLSSGDVLPRLRAAGGGRL